MWASAVTDAVTRETAYSLWSVSIRTGSIAIFHTITVKKKRETIKDDKMLSTDVGLPDILCLKAGRDLSKTLNHLVFYC